jgi:hypothetical protein
VIGLAGFGLFQQGVRIDGDNNVVAGNAFLQPLGAGVYVTGQGNRIGGTLPGERNTISSVSTGSRWR